MKLLSSTSRESSAPQGGVLSWMCGQQVTGLKGWDLLTHDCKQPNLGARIVQATGRDWLSPSHAATHKSDWVKTSGGVKDVYCTPPASKCASLFCCRVAVRVHHKIHWTYHTQRHLHADVEANVLLWAASATLLCGRSWQKCVTCYLVLLEIRGFQVSCCEAPDRWLSHKHSLKLLSYTVYNILAFWKQYI